MIQIRNSIVAGELEVDEKLMAKHQSTMEALLTGLRKDLNTMAAARGRDAYDLRTHKPEIWDIEKDEYDKIFDSLAMFELHLSSQWSMYNMKNLLEAGLHDAMSPVSEEEEQAATKLQALQRGRMARARLQET
jgi:hypothetical protein